MSDLMARLRDSLGDEFDFVRPLGEGSVAEVFLAREAGLDRPVAIKVLRGSLARDETARGRFLREARLAARIRHPSVVAVHRVGELEGDRRPYLVMEYIDGRTFEDVLAATGPLPEDEVRRILVEVSKGLEAAHEMGVIHRDIRPANILRARDADRIVLADFGLAGILETGSETITRLTRAGEILGDVEYTPPEQLRGEPVQPGSDIYALAVTAYELLSGDGPFPDATKPAGLIDAHLQADPTPLRALRSDVSPVLEDLLLRCLQKKPERRPSARRLRRGLLAGEDGVAGPEGAVASFLHELKRRHVYKVGAAYGAFVLVVLAFVDAALPALPLPLPEWTDTAVVTVTLTGFPLALILAWVYDLTSGGVRRTRAPTGGARGLRVLQIAGLVGAVVVAGVLGWIYLGG